MRYARGTRAFTCKRTFGASTRIMANESSPGDLERTTNNTDEEDLENESLDDTAPENSDWLLNADQSLNKTVADMASSFAEISGAITALKTLPAERDSREARLAPSDGQTAAKKSRADISDTGSDSEDDVKILLETHAANETEGGKSSPANLQDSCKEGGDELLTKLALKFTKDDKASSPVSKQLAGIINKRWAAKLSDGKVKEKVEKYHRPENCEKLAVPKEPRDMGQIDPFREKAGLKIVRCSEPAGKR